jgi:hypothetical protein
LYGGRPREHGAALDAFARRWYSKDLELYERHCGTVKGPRQVYGNASSQAGPGDVGPFGEPIFAWEP